MNATQASIIELLRTATTEQHRALERTPMMASLMNQDLSLARYAQVLMTFASFYAALDPLLIAATRSCEGLPETYRYHARLPYLKRDLATLREYVNDPLDWQPANLAALFNNELTRQLTREQTLGFVYVIEGSSQGGKIIAPRLAKRLKLSGDAGLSFFYHFAFQANAWPVFRAMLMQMPAKKSMAQQNRQICDAACTLFQALTTLTAQPQPIPTLATIR